MGCDIHIFPEAFVEDGGYWELIMDIDLEQYIFDKRTNKDPEKHNYTIYRVVDKPRAIYVTFPNIFDMNFEGEDISVENYYRFYYSKQLGVDKRRFESRDYDLFSLLADVRSDEEEERPSEYLPFCGYGWGSGMSYALYDLWNIAYGEVDFHSHVVYNAEDLLSDDFVHQCETSEGCGTNFLKGVSLLKQAVDDKFPQYSDLRFNICFDN